MSLSSGISSFARRAYQAAMPGMALRRMEAKTRIAHAEILLAQTRKLHEAVESMDAELLGIMGVAHDAAGRGPLVKDIQGQAYSADGAVVPDTPLMNARSRDLVRNDALAKAAVFARRRKVVGGGIQSKAAAVDPATAKATPRTEIFNRQADRRFEAWARNPLLCDYERKRTFRQIQQWCIDEFATTGNVFVKPVIVTDAHGTHLALQTFEVEQLAYAYWRLFSETPNGNMISGGVEIDPEGRVVAYHFYAKRHPLDTGFGESVVRVPREELLVWQNLDRCRQSLGVTMFAPVLVALAMRKQYAIYNLVRAKVEMSLGVFLKGAKSNALTKGFSLKNTDGTGTTDASGNDKIELMPNMVHALPRDVEPVFVDPKTPGNNFAPFMLHQFIEAAMGLGLGYATVTRDYSKHTFSGLKVDESDTRAQIEPEQFDLIDLILRPSRAFWTRLEIAAGRLAAPEFFRSADWAMAMTETMWRGPAKPVLDENKRASSNEQNLVNGLDSPQSMVAEDGEDLYEVTENIMAYKGFLDARKFPYPGWLRKWLGQSDAAGGAAPPADSSAEKIDEEERKALALSEGVTV